MKNIILTLLLFVSIDVIAQYGDAYHAPNNYLIEKQQREYTQGIIDNASVNRNAKNPTYVLSDDTELKNWIKGLKKFEKYPKRVLSAEEIEFEKQRAIKNKIAMDNIKLQNDKNDAIINLRAQQFTDLVAPYIETLKNAGFTARDADFTGYKHLWDRTTLTKKYQADDIMQLAPIMKYVKDNITTISFDELQSMLSLLYFYAPETSFDIIKQVRGRFPDKQPEFDNMTMNSIENYFFSDYQTSNANEIVNTYFDLIKKYPKMAHSFMLYLNAGKGIYYDPYIVKASSVKFNPTEIDKKENRNYRQERLMAITGMTKYDKNWYKPKQMIKILNETRLKLSDVVFLAANNSNYLRLAYENIYNYQNFTLKHDGFIDSENPFHHFSYLLETFEAMAEEGNEDAIKMYAISTCNGRDYSSEKKNAKQDKMLAKVKKWAVSGNYTATIMLFKVMIWEQYHSGGQHLNSPQNCDNAIAIAKNNEKSFSKEQLKQMATIIGNLDIKHDWWNERDGKSVDPVLSKIKTYSDELIINNR